MCPVPTGEVLYFSKEYDPMGPIDGYVRARVSPRATFPCNGRVIPRVTQVLLRRGERVSAHRRRSSGGFKATLDTLPVCNKPHSKKKKIFDMSRH